ncbi:MAG: hypothetical protein BGP05_03990 [Rhizobiales bacterium 62-47]|nr:MAG: hypothetical protein BGP05_03990 [Rhizobiales bacterium 62-47]
MLPFGEVDHPDGRSPHAEIASLTEFREVFDQRHPNVCALKSNAVGPDVGSLSSLTRQQASWRPQ